MFPRCDGAIADAGVTLRRVPAGSPAGAEEMALHPGGLFCLKILYVLLPAPKRWGEDSFSCYFGTVSRISFVS